MADSVKKLTEQVEQLRRELDRSTKILKVSQSGADLVRFVTTSDDPLFPGKIAPQENPWVLPQKKDSCC